MSQPAVHAQRTLVALVVGEAVPITALIAVIVVRGTLAPMDDAATQEFAGRAGSWIGPLGGFITVLLMSRWAGLRSSRPVLQGGLIGAVIAAVDFAILAGAGTPFAWLFVLSNGGKIVAGLLGGWLAQRAVESRAAAAPHA